MVHRAGSLAEQIPRPNVGSDAGSLAEVIPKSPSASVVTGFMSQLASGFDYLHEQKVAITD